MRTITIAAIGFACLTLAACGGTTTAATCGPGTMLVNGQCLAAASGGASGGAGGASGGGGAGGDSFGGAGGDPGGSAGAPVDAGGATPTDYCAGRDVLATGAPGLLDDFEDHDIRVVLNDGRSGEWNLQGDGCTPGPTPLLPDAPTTGMTFNNASKYAMRATGSGCKTVSIATAFNGYGDGVNFGMCAYDASAYDGMSFWAMGVGIRLNVQVGLRTTIAAKFGGDGSCARNAMGDNGCWDFHGVPVVLTTDWKQYSFTWSQLHQAGWGTRTSWNAKLTTEIAFAASSNDAASTNIDFSIDNVGFFKGTPPIDPPIPGP